MIQRYILTALIAFASKKLMAASKKRSADKKRNTRR